MTGSLRLSVRNLDDAEPHPARNSAYSTIIPSELMKRITARLASGSLVHNRTFLSNVTPTDHIRRCAYPGPNGIIVIAETASTCPGSITWTT